MEYRSLGQTGIRVSAISFGAGPVSQLLTGDDRQRQLATIAAAIEGGINWFDTAATYGNGESERNLGRLLAELQAADRVHVATKVRLQPVELDAIGAHVRDSVQNSLHRLGLKRVTLLQIHNSITHRAGSQPTSLTPGHVLDPGGLLEAMDDLRRQGLVEHFGLTGLGDPAAVDAVMASGAFATLQIPYNLLNPSAGQPVAEDFPEVNYDNLISHAARRGMGVFAIRVLAGGAVAGLPPSPHTLKTPFFPLDLYERDVRRTTALGELLPANMSREEAAVRFALSHPEVSSALLGIGAPEQLRQLVDYAAAGLLAGPLLKRLQDRFPFEPSGRH